MNLKNGNYKQIWFNIFLVNATGIMFAVLLFSCYFETRSSEYLYGLFFLLLFVLLDLLFYAIRIFLFSKVVIEDGKIKEKFFKRTIKEIDLKDIKFLFFDVNTLFISSQEIRIENFGLGRQLNKILYSKETIYFTINLDEIDSLLESIELEICHVSNRVQKELKEKIKSYFDVLEFYWDKEVKRFKYR